MRFTLEPGRWYAMELIGPEFGEEIRSCSPIRVSRIDALGGGSREFQLDFFHANYPAGVQDKSYRIKTISRDQNYLLGRVAGTDRLVLIFDLHYRWINSHFNANLSSDEDIETWCGRL